MFYFRVGLVNLMKSNLKKLLYIYKKEKQLVVLERKVSSSYNNF